MEKEILYENDLRNIADLLVMDDRNANDKTNPRQRYAKLLRHMADTMLSDDGIVITEGFFSRQHGV